MRAHLNFRVGRGFGERYAGGVVITSFVVTRTAAQSVALPDLSPTRGHNVPPSPKILPMGPKG